MESGPGRVLGIGAECVGSRFKRLKPKLGARDGLDVERARA